MVLMRTVLQLVSPVKGRTASDMMINITDEERIVYEKNRIGRRHRA